MKKELYNSPEDDKMPGQPTTNITYSSSVLNTLLFNPMRCHKICQL